MQIISHGRGFTLIETAIVMLLAGLLMGGLLKGQELVAQTRSKQVLADFNSLQAAVHTYRDRYRALPGDDRDGQSRWGAYGAKSGDQDGVISGKYQDRLPPGADPTSLAVSAASGESQNFWWHLRLAGFVLGPSSGPGATDLPLTAFSGILGVQSGEPARPGFLQGLMVCASNVPGRSAFTIESEFDDRSPTSGKVRALLQPGATDTPPLSAALNAANYVEDGNSRYVVCRELD